MDVSAHSDLEEITQKLSLFKNSYLEEKRLRRELQTVVQNYKEELLVSKSVEKEERMRYNSSQQYIAVQQEIVTTLLSVKAENLKLQSNSRELEDQLHSVQKKLGLLQQEYEQFQNKSKAEKEDLLRELETCRSVLEIKTKEMASALKATENNLAKTRSEMNEKLNECEHEKNEQMNIVKFLYEEKVKELENALQAAHQQNREFQNEANATIAVQKGKIMELETCLERTTQKISAKSVYPEKYQYPSLQSEVLKINQKGKRVNFSKENVCDMEEEKSNSTHGKSPIHAVNKPYQVNFVKLKQRLPAAMLSSPPSYDPPHSKKILQSSYGYGNRESKSVASSNNGNDTSISYTTDETVKSNVTPTKKRKLFSHSHSDELL